MNILDAIDEKEKFEISRIKRMFTKYREMSQSMQDVVDKYGFEDIQLLEIFTRMVVNVPFDKLEFEKRTQELINDGWMAEKRYIESYGIWQSFYKNGIGFSIQLYARDTTSGNKVCKIISIGQENKTVYDWVCAEA